MKKILKGYHFMAGRHLLTEAIEDIREHLFTSKSECQDIGFHETAHRYEIEVSVRKISTEKRRKK